MTLYVTGKDTLHRTDSEGSQTYPFLLVQNDITMSIQISRIPGLIIHKRQNSVEWITN